MKQIDLKKEIQEKAKQTALTFREAAKGMKAWKDAENDRETDFDFINFDNENLTMFLFACFSEI